MGRCVNLLPAGGFCQSSAADGPGLAAGGLGVYTHIMRQRPAPLDQATAAAVQRCTCFNLRKATRAVTQYYDDVLRPSGLRATQFSLLMVLRAAGPLRLTELAEMAVMDRTTLKRNLDLLERERLVRVEPGEDARVREVSLTDAAGRRLEAALPYWEQAQARITSSLGRGRQERLLGDLSAAVAAAIPGVRLRVVPRAGHSLARRARGAAPGGAGGGEA